MKKRKLPKIGDEIYVWNKESERKVRATFVAFDGYSPNQFVLAVENRHKFELHMDGFTVKRWRYFEVIQKENIQEWLKKEEKYELYKRGELYESITGSSVVLCTNGSNYRDSEFQGVVVRSKSQNSVGKIIVCKKEMFTLIHDKDAESATSKTLKYKSKKLWKSVINNLNEYISYLKNKE